MEALHSPVPDPDGGVSHVAALMDALATERRLLDELARVLVVQREGISCDDLQALDESVFSAHRVFRTLQEARQRRRTLLRLIGTDEKSGLGDLESALGPGATPELMAVRDELLDAAERLARELTMNRRVIDGAIAVGGQLLQLFTGASERPTLYAQDAEPDSGGSTGALLNTRV